VLPVEELLRRLMHDVLLATPGPRDLPERQQTINATVAWSYHLLAPNEQRLFRRLGVLPGRFPIEAAAAILAGRGESSPGSDEALCAAAGLIDKSLLVRSESSVASRPLYDMLETVRAYAALELTAAGERDDALEGLVRYITTEASLAAEGLVGPAQVEWLDRVRDDLESYELVLLLGHPRAYGRGHPLVWTDPEPVLASGGCRIESAARNGSDAVHAGRTRLRTHGAHARPRARP
jgi:predicted ATPase